MNINDKRKKTVLSRYGVENVSQLDWVQEKRKNTFERTKDIAIFYQPPRTIQIDGENLTPYKLDLNVAKDWLNTYHPFGYARGTLLALGLVKDDCIYCMMTFKKSRNKSYHVELCRMWMLPSYNIIKGYDILSSFASEFGISNLVAYVNMSFENYKDYESIGMKYIRFNQKTLWWMNSKRRISDASRRQKGISRNEMIFLGYVPIYDCGQRVYVFE